MNQLSELTKLFMEFPGIGPRQAKRFAYFMLTRNQGFVNQFVNLVTQVRSNVRLCESCGRYFMKQAKENAQCDVCESTRDTSLLTIVARDADFEHLEKTGAYRGYYFVLGGLVPILDDEPEQKIRLKELVRIIEKRSEQGLKEIVLALSVNSEGEHTEAVVKKYIKTLCEERGIVVTHLGRGLSTGSELEYSDKDTLVEALKNRR